MNLQISQAIPHRNMKFDHHQSHLQAHKYFLMDQNPVISILFVILSTVFAPGEDFSAQSIRHFKNQVTDKKLLAEIKGFIGQEALHAREHRRLNQLFIDKGYDLHFAETVINASFNLLKKLPKTLQLSTTSLMEHFTASMAEQWWLNNDLLASQSDENVMQFWQWHALEELEHKAVSYEMLKLVTDYPWLCRLAAFPLVFTTVVPATLIAWGHLIVKEQKVSDIHNHIKALRFLWGIDGMFTRIMLKQIPKFAHPHFHPDQHDTQALESQWRERLFGIHGTLNAVYLNKDKRSPLAAIEPAS